MPKRCELKAHHGVEALCDESECPFWRAADYLHLEHAPSEGCAIQFFSLLGEKGSEIASWLLTVKERVDALQAAQALAAQTPAAQSDDEPGDSLSQ